MRPDDLRATADALHISWADGVSAIFPATELRAAARDAASQGQAYDTGKIDVLDGLTITSVDHVGAYGLNIAFSDGQDRAIYPFSYLRELRGLETN